MSRWLSVRLLLGCGGVIGQSRNEVHCQEHERQWFRLRPFGSDISTVHYLILEKDAAKEM